MPSVVSFIPSLVGSFDTFCHFPQLFSPRQKTRKTKSMLFYREVKTRLFQRRKTLFSCVVQSFYHSRDGLSIFFKIYIITCVIIKIFIIAFSNGFDCYRQKILKGVKFARSQGRSNRGYGKRVATLQSKTRGVYEKSSVFTGDLRLVATAFQDCKTPKTATLKPCKVANCNVSVTICNLFPGLFGAANQI